jgi:hypothetical protein
MFLSTMVPAIALLPQETLRAKIHPSKMPPPKMHLLIALRVEALPAALLLLKASQILSAPKPLSMKPRVGVMLWTTLLA